MSTNDISQTGNGRSHRDERTLNLHEYVDVAARDATVDGSGADVLNYNRAEADRGIRNARMAITTQASDYNSIPASMNANDVSELAPESRSGQGSATERGASRLKPQGVKRNKKLVKKPRGVERNKTLVKSQKPKRIDRFSEWVNDLWLFEILAWVLGTICLGGIALTLSLHADRPLPNWPLSITLNALISTLASISKAALMVPVASSISQRKWLWLSTGRWPLSDIEIYDEASRGPWGSLMMLFEIRWRYG